MTSSFNIICGQNTSFNKQFFCGSYKPRKLHIHETIQIKRHHEENNEKKFTKLLQHFPSKHIYSTNSKKLNISTSSISLSGSASILFYFVLFHFIILVFIQKDTSRHDQSCLPFISEIIFFVLIGFSYPSVIRAYISWQDMSFIFCYYLFS